MGANIVPDFILFNDLKNSYICSQTFHLKAPKIVRNLCIIFSSTLANQKITLTSGDINITKNATIDGSGAKRLSLNGNNVSRIFNLSAKNLNVTVKNLSVVNGRAAGAGDDGEGGAIKVGYTSTLTIENSLFKYNKANRGGAVEVGNAGSLIVRNSTFDSNDGTIANDGLSGGAIATDGAGGTLGKGKLIVEGSTFINNKGSDRHDHRLQQQPGHDRSATDLCQTRVCRHIRSGSVHSVCPRGAVWQQHNNQAGCRRRWGRHKLCHIGQADQSIG